MVALILVQFRLSSGKCLQNNHLANEPTGHKSLKATTTSERKPFVLGISEFSYIDAPINAMAQMFGKMAVNGFINFGSGLSA